MAGFTKGPNMLKKVFRPNSLLIDPTNFIAGWNKGACKKQRLEDSICSLKTLHSDVNLVPKNSITVLDPQFEEIP
jgi:hypothetical protein